MFKYSLLAIALITFAVACNKKEEAPVEAAPAVEETAPVEAAPVVEEAAPAEEAPAAQ